MSTTFFVVREADGQVWWALQLDASVDHESAAELLALIDTLDRRPPAEYLDEGHFWDQGCYVDRARRLARLDSWDYADDSRLDRDRDLAAMEGWAGWDVACAWEGQHEIAALAGLPPIEDLHFDALDRWRGCAAAGLLTCHPDPTRFPHRWDAAAGELRYADYGAAGTDVSVIDAELRARTYGFADRAMLFASLGRGPALLDELAAEAPVPRSTARHAGALIDVERRAIHVWIGTPIAPATYEELRRRWPGWTIERERGQRAGHRQRLGVRAEWMDMEHPPYPLEEPRPLRHPRCVKVDAAEVPPRPLPAAEATLLAAVHADPSSDAPRLVYADYLLERGDRRGDLIAVQCELARMQRDADYAPRRRYLAACEWRLLQWHGRIDGDRAWHAEPVRGFLGELTTYGLDIPRFRELLRDVPTVERLRVRERLDARGVGELVGLPGFERVVSLEIDPREGGLVALANAPEARRLRRLAIVGFQAPLAEAQAAVRGDSTLAGLEELELDHVTLRDAYVADVLRAVRLPSLRRLYVKGDDLGAGTIAVLATSPAFTGLVALELEYGKLEVGHVEALLAAPGLAGLRHLRLPALRLDGPGALPGLDRLPSISLSREHLDDVTLDGLRARLGDRLQVR